MIDLKRMRFAYSGIGTRDKWLALAPKREFGPHWLAIALCLIGSLALVLERNPGADAPTPGLQLDRYRLAGMVEIPGVADNASGITYNPDSDTLFVVVNNPELLLELSKTGRLLRRIPLHGLQDTEGVVYLGRDTFAVLEERRRNIVLFEVGKQTRSVDLQQSRSLALPVHVPGNHGFEGLTADPRSGSLFVVNEKHPRQLWRVDGFVEGRQALSITMPWDLDLRPWGSRDFSGLHYDSRHNTLLLLSDESRQLIETNLQGALLSRLNLNRGQAGLGESVPQAEGVAMDRDGILYIVSEPNRLYRFHSRE